MRCLAQCLKHGYLMLTNVTSLSPSLVLYLQQSHHHHQPQTQLRNYISDFLPQDSISRSEWHLELNSSSSSFDLSVLPPVVLKVCD